MRFRPEFPSNQDTGKQEDGTDDDEEEKEEEKSRPGARNGEPECNVCEQRH